MLLTVVCVKFQILQLPLAITTILLASLLLLISYQGQHIKESIVYLVFALLGLGVYLTPSHIRYYLINIHWNQNVDMDYHHWDKYSYYLYLAEEYEESLNASDKAKQIVVESDDTEWTAIIMKHNQCITTKCNWTTYR